MNRCRTLLCFDATANLNACPFLVLQHASHVTMSVVKLIARITDDRENKGTATAQDRHDSTFGINSDPLTHFACVFSALIHDLDHPGIPNQILSKENPTLARHYNNRSIAEQQSFDLAWGLLMEDRYDKLRTAIFQTEAEKTRFRQIVVNSVMATDLMDPALKQLRDNRWNKAFAASSGSAMLTQEDANRKATIIIEHILQASDVAHTMQHWHIYRKWNQALFKEMFLAYQEGRSTTDPSEFWYHGEIAFFDSYIIPLAKKLKECGVFGSSSDEYLNYAENNKKEWIAKGRQVVEEMVQECEADLNSNEN